MATPYHRLARETPAYAWWKLPVAGLVALCAYLGLTILLVLGALVVYALDGRPEALDRWFEAAGELDLGRLDFFALDLLSLALLIPAILVGVLAVGPRPVGYLSSVTGRLRWGWLGLTSLIAFPIFVVTLGVALAVSDVGGGSPGSVSLDSRAVAAIAVVIMIVPFQAAAEEYLFRGYLMQLVGSWSRFAVLPVLVSTPLFVAGHGYDVWGLADVAIFGFTAAILTIRTGGLEAAIAAHTANNVVLLALDALGVLSATGSDDLGPVDLVPTAVSSVLLIVVIELVARRRGIRRTRDPIPEPAPPAAPMWPPPPYAMPWFVPQPWEQQAPYGPAPTEWGTPAHRPGPRRPVLHPDTPDYPGDLPADWDRR